MPVRIKIKHPLLKNYVHHISFSEFSAYGSDLIPVVPDGMTELVINIGEAYEREYPKGNHLMKVKGSHFIGMKSAPAKVRPHRDMKAVSIRFLPGAVSFFIRQPLDQLIDEVIDAEILFGGAIRELEDRINDLNDNEAVLDLLENFLLNLFSENQRSKYVLSRIETIYRNPTANGYSELFENVKSYKSEERVFKRCLGLTPKLFMRIVKFNYSTCFFKKANASTLTEIAYVSGYYDQAHFIRSFREFSGMTPGQYLNCNEPMLIENGMVINSQFNIQ